MNKLSSGVLTPAYGRKYNKMADVEKDFRDGKDFVVHLLSGHSTYCSIADFVDGARVQIRYGKNNSKVMVVKV